MYFRAVFHCPNLTFDRNGIRIKVRITEAAPECPTRFAISFNHNGLTWRRRRDDVADRPAANKYTLSRMLEIYLTTIAAINSFTGIVSQAKIVSLTCC